MADKLVDFTHGSTWVRADFHLHTRADKEFRAEENNGYVSSYVDALADAGIGLGVITNHNKFDFDEFKALRKSAGKRGIGLLPGVELSVNDGANGVHTLIIFGSDWIAEGRDHINPFLTSVFEGKVPQDYEHENGRTSTDLEATVKKLNSYHKPFGLIFAHVEQSSGLWDAVDGGRMTELGKKPWFAEHVLGFQKVRTHDDRQKVRGWLGAVYPAEVEGSDPKALDQIGKTGPKGEQTWIKIGAFSLEAVALALREQDLRLRSERPNTAHAHIANVSFTGGILKDQTIPLSPGLNVLIGVRGSGKSSILESIRYGLDIPFGKHVSDREYKNRLPNNTLGSGGKLVLEVRSQHQETYVVERILNQRADLKKDGQVLDSLNIRETILPHPLYFGQKDLSATTADFEADLVERLVGEKLRQIRAEITTQQEAVQEGVRRYLRIGQLGERIEEVQQDIQDCEYKLKVFKEHGVEDKLKKQTLLHKDRRHCGQALEHLEALKTALEDVLTDHEDEVRGIARYTSTHNADLMEPFHAALEPAVATLDQLRQHVQALAAAIMAATPRSAAFDQRHESTKEEFAKIQQELAVGLQSAGVATLSPDDFIDEVKKLDLAKAKLKSLLAEQGKSAAIKQELLNDLHQLNELWLQEFRALEEAVDGINGSQEALRIKVTFKGDRDKFLNYLQDMCRGSKLRASTLEKIVGSYKDAIELFKNPSQAKTDLGTGSWATFEEYWSQELGASLCYQVPNSVDITYHGQELRSHSLGQRASALILFVLSQRDSNLIIIDQPEDDLDNQTIYKDVITLIRALKKETQFIFASHNPNIPVLGDADQVIVCHFNDNQMHVETGSVDHQVTQGAIVHIMEGGDAAFNKRKEIYRLWRPQTSSTS